MRYALLFLSLFVMSMGIAQKTPSAASVLEVAYKQAAKENKKVMLIFHASWCGWCRKMDASLADPSVKNYFNKNYVIVHLTVHESKGKEAMENPGALDFLTKMGGEGQGLPYWFVLDKSGNKLADSQVTPGVNSGCPASKEEVQHFIDVLRKTSIITNAELSAIAERFRKNEQ